MSNLIAFPTGVRPDQPSGLPVVVLNQLQTHEAASALMNAIARRNDPPFLFRKDQSILWIYPDGNSSGGQAHASALDG